MKRAIANVWMLLGIVGVLLGERIVIAGEHRDATHHFAFRIPDDWELLPSSFVESMNEMLHLSFPDADVEFDYAFGAKDQAPGTYPYVIVDVISVRTAGASYDDLEQIAAAITNEVRNIKIEGSIADTIKNISPGTAVYDRASNRIVSQALVNYEGIGDVRGLSVGFIGADQLVNVHGYAPDTEFAGALPTLNVIFDSFQFEPGYSFVPAKKTALRDRIVQSALIGAIAGGCAPIILYLFKRHRSAGVASVHG